NPVEKDQHRLEPGIGNEQLVTELRQVIAIFCGRRSHGISFSNGDGEEVRRACLKPGLYSRRHAGQRTLGSEINATSISQYSTHLATSIEELITKVGITKSGFFYHFRDRNSPPKAMTEHFLEQDRSILEKIFRRGDHRIHCIAFSLTCSSSLRCWINSPQSI